MPNITKNPSTTLLSQFRHYLKNLGLSDLSIKNYTADVSRFIAWCTDKLRTLTPSSLADPKLAHTYQSYLVKSGQLSPSSINRAVISLKHFGAMLSQAYVRENPFSNLDKLGNPPRSSRFSIYIKQFTNYLESKHLSQGTVKSYKSDVTGFIKYLDSRFPSNPLIQLLTSKNAHNYLKNLQNSPSLSIATRARKEKVIRLFVAWVTRTFDQVQMSDKEKIQTWTPLSPQITAPGAAKLPPPRPWITVLSFILPLLLTLALGFFGYRQLSRDRVILSQAYPSTPVTPNRQISFQGRLENAAGTPITTATNFVFKLFDASSGGTQLYTSGTCSITPDSDGVFSTQIGDTCGSAIDASVFTENADVWLEVTVASETLDPRQQIATVAYALNTETIQGFPLSSTVSALRNTIVPMNQYGEVILGEQSPRLKSVAGTFGISGAAISLTTATGTNGSITIAPDGTGSLNLTGSTTTQNFVRVTNANLSSGHLISGYVGNDTATGDLLNLSSGASETEKFAVDRSGNTDIAGSLYVGTSDAFQVNSSGIISLIDGVAHTIDDVSGNLTLTSNSSTISLNDSVTFSSTTTLNGITYTWPGSQNTNYILATDGSGTLSWVDPNTAGAGSVYWNQSNGSLYPKNSTVDLLIGAQATASAKFAVLNVNSGTPVASVSSGLSGTSAFLTADGTLATRNRMSLTLGNSSTYDTTGNVLINSNGTGNVGVGTTTPSTAFHVYSSTGGSAKTLTESGDSLGIYTGIKNTDQEWWLGMNSLEDFLIYDRGAGTPIPFTIENGTPSNTLYLDSPGNIGIGTTAPDARLEINHATGDNLRLTYNDSDGSATNYTDFSLASDGDLTIDSSGNNLTLSDAVTFGSTTTLNGLTYTWPGSQAANYVLQTNGSGTLSWVDASAVVGNNVYWNQSNGSLYPKNSTVDLLIGAQATASAKFAVLNVNSGTPVASMSSSYWTSDGTLATTTRQSLTLGNSSTYNTTGNVLINSNGTGNVGVGLTNPTSKFVIYDASTATQQEYGTLKIVNKDDTVEFLYMGWDNTRGTYGSAYIQSIRSGTAYTPLLLNPNAGTVGIGTVGPDARLDVLATSGEQLRLTYTDGTVYAGFTVDSSGNLAVKPTAALYLQPNADTGDYVTLSSDGTDLTLATTDASHLTINPAGNLVLTGALVDINASANLDVDVTGTVDILASSTFSIDGTGASNVSATSGNLTLSTITSGDLILTKAGNLVFTGFNCTGNANGGALTADASGIVSCTDDDSGGSGSSNWRFNLGTLSPVNDTVDLLVGANATASAKFAVLNVNSGTPTASVSAGTAGAAYLTATGNLATTAMQSLTLGGSTTGNVTISENTSITGHAGIGGTDSFDGASFINDGLSQRAALTVRESATALTGYDQRSGINNFLNLNPSGSVTNYSVGINNEVNTEPGNAQNFSSIYGDITWAYHEGSGTVSSLIGADIDVYKTAGAGAITNVRGITLFAEGGTSTRSFISEAYRSTGTQADTAGTTSAGEFYSTNNLIVTTGTDTTYGLYTSITRTGATGGTLNTYGNYIDIGSLDNAGSGTHNAYGLYVDSVTGADTNYAIYSAGGQSYFAGNIGIGATVPSTTLHVKSSDNVAIIEGDEVEAGLTTGQLHIRGATNTNKRLVLGYDTTSNFGFIEAGISGTGYSPLILNGNGSGAVGIGTEGPDATLDVLATSGEQLRLTYTDGTVYAGFTVDSSGNLAVKPTAALYLQPNADTGDYFALSSDGTDLTIATTDAANLIINPDSTADIFFHGTTYNLSDTGDLTLGGRITFENSEYIENETNGTVNVGTTILGLVGGTSLVTDQLSFDLFNTTTTTLNVAGAATTINLGAGGALTRAINIGTGTGADTISIGTGGTTADTINIGGLTTTQTTFTGVVNFAGGTTYYVDASGNAKFNDIVATDTGNPGLTVGNGTTGFIKVGSSTIMDNATAYLGIDPDSDTTAEFVFSDAGLFGVGTLSPDYMTEIVSADTTGLLELTGDSITTGTAINISLDGLSSGKGLYLESTSTSYSTGNLAYYYWNPGSATTASGDIFKINIGANATLTGDIFTVQDNGSDLFKVQQSGITSALPHAFTAAGDVSVAYDLVFTNQTASKIEAYGPLTIEGGESFENNDLTLKTYGTGALVVDAAGGSEFTRSGAAVASFNRTSSDGTIISIQQAGTEEGTISVSGTTVSYNAFTGSHYAWLDSPVEPAKGELVSFTNRNARLHNKPTSEILYGIKRTDKQNDSQVLGMYLAKLESTQPSSSDNPHLVMAVGNAELWVVDTGSPISTGDRLISSSVPGHAEIDPETFATSYIVARAAEKIDWSKVTETTTDGRKHKRISVLVEPHTVDRRLSSLLTVNDSGNLVKFQDLYSAEASKTANSLQTLTAQLESTLSAIFASLQNLENRLASLEQEPISPRATFESLESETHTTTSLSARNATISTLTLEEATVSGTLSTRLAKLEELEVETIRAGNIVADSIQANSIEGLDAKIASLSSGTIINQYYYATASSTLSLSDDQLGTITQRIKSRIRELTEDIPTAQDIPQVNVEEETVTAAITATPSASLTPVNLDTVTLVPSLSADFVSVNDYLAVIGQATITTLDVTNTLFTETINAKSGILALQPLGGIVKLAGDTLVADSSGNVTINGNLTVTGELRADSLLGNMLEIYGEDGSVVGSIDASGSANLASLTTQIITIASAGDASGSATPSALAQTLGFNVESNATAGSATLVSPNTELIISSPHVTSDTLVYLTPTTNTDNKVLFVKSKTVCDTSLASPSEASCVGGFTVGIDTPASTDISFNWWIIRLQP